MNRIEQAILQMAESRKDILFFIAVTLIGGFLRLSVRYFISPDMTGFLMPWYEEIKTGGGFMALKGMVGNYGFPYQFLIAIMTYIPLSSVSCYKLLSCVFDFGLAFISAKFACALRREKSAPLFLIVYGMILLSPVVVINSSIWGQCDSIYTFFLVLGCYNLWQERYRAAFAWIGVSLAFKLQAVFIFPFLIFYYVKEKKFSMISGLGVSALAYCIMQLPGLVMGHSLLDSIQIYIEQTNCHPAMWWNYPSFWVMVGNDYIRLKSAAILFTIGILGIGLYAFLCSTVRLVHSEIFIGILIWNIWTCVLFLPAMHERYGYFVDILVIIHAIISLSTKRDTSRYTSGGAAVAVILCSVATYSHFLWGTEIDLKVYSIVNIVAYFCYLCYVIESVRRAACEGK